MARQFPNAAVILMSGGLLLTGSAIAEKELSGKPDDTWVTLDGVVVSSTDDSFQLDYGEGLVTVEMDDWDWFQEAQGLIAGDEVTVRGKIDDAFFEERSIEAASVFVDDLNTYFYASPADEENIGTVSVAVVTPVVDSNWLNVSGEVTEVGGREFMIETGTGEIKVDTLPMAYNPLDDVGFQKIDKGDRVAVSGPLDLDFFEKQEIQAHSITSLERDEQKSAANQTGTASESG